ncbi:MAG: Gfo/Idh/MocA family protein [Anaerolineae bacterium]
MNRLPLAIIGCGGMGGRHLLGLKALVDSGLCNIDLIAACDVRQENAELLADNAHDLFGKRPAVFRDMDEMAHALPELAAVDITTDAGSHQRVTCHALELGWHVLSEKPLALTIRGCNLIIAAQNKAGRILSVAENYRRDPLCRLTKALLEAGVIGKPYMLLDLSASSSDKIIILPWRHYKHVGGILIDAGVHNADMMQYYLGNITEVYGKTELFEPIRYKPDSSSALSPFYEHWQGEIPAQIQATAEDSLLAILQFEGGFNGQWTAFHAAHGEGFGRTMIYGSRGSLRSGGARSGVPPTLTLDGRGELKPDELLPLVPDFHLDEITARLYGSDRLASYQIPFPEADRRLLAIEYYEFGQCVLDGRNPEVDALVGRRDLAVCYAIFESSLLNRPVTLAEIESERTGFFEADINTHWGI